jgi:choline kinase
MASAVTASAGCGARLVGLERGHHAVAVELGQVHVADDQVRQLAPGSRHARLAIAGRQRRVAEGAQQIHHQLHVGGVVFDDQDTC